jgi:hypothetical protein
MISVRWPKRVKGALPMKIAVLGAGCGGLLLRLQAGARRTRCCAIARPQHVEAIERHGLRLETQTFDERIRVSASTEASAVQGAQLVLFCVKSNDTESGAAAIKPHLAPDASVLSAAKRRRERGPTTRVAATGSGRSRGICRDRNGRAGACQASWSRRTGHRAVEGQR